MAVAAAPVTVAEFRRFVFEEGVSGGWAAQCGWELTCAAAFAPAHGMGTNKMNRCGMEAV
jgi:hypothetical protein